MADNNSKLHVGYLAGRFPGKIGHLYSPGGFRGPYGKWLPYALDNGRFIATTQNKPWDPDRYYELLDKSYRSCQKPLWVIVPDVVGDRDATLREWERWINNKRFMGYGFQLAMAVQDGMSPSDVPDGVVCFIGGTKLWKWNHLEDFTSELNRVHVGRVNRPRRLWECYRLGVESVDGTGFYRGDQTQLSGLVSFLERTNIGDAPPAQEKFQWQ